MADPVRMDEHVWQAKIENAQFLLDNGASRDEVAKRVGVNVDTVKKWIEAGKLVRR